MGQTRKRHYEYLGSDKTFNLTKGFVTNIF